MTHGEKRIQSSIAVINFPETLEELDTELEPYRQYGAERKASRWLTSMGLVLYFDPERDR